LGYPYPVEVVWAETILAGNAQAGDTLWVWDAKTGKYLSNIKGEDGEWSAPDMTIQAGQGFWFTTSRDPFTNVEKRPY
jgi:hypothetical protein